jgi:hypothetical protein
MPIIEGTKKVTGSLGRGEAQYAHGLYDFAVDGGAVGSITLRGDAVIPSGAIIIDSGINVDTAPTSGGAATIAVQSEAAGDIQAAAAISGAPWSTTGAKRGSLTATSAPVKTTAARTLTAVVGTAALTAGKFTIWAAYLVLS